MTHGLNAAAAALCLATLAGCASSTRNARSYSGPLSLILVNDTDREICSVRMSPVRDPNWGDDWLSRYDTIHPGGSRRFNVAAGETWDIRALGCSREVLGEARSVRLVAPTQLRVRSMPQASHTTPVAAP